MPMLRAVLLFAVMMQILAPEPPSLQHVTVEAAPIAPTVARGETITLFANVTPNPDVHVYATAKFGFTPVSLVLTPNARVSRGKTKFPPARPKPTLGVSEPVPMYDRPFRIEQPITILKSAKPGEMVTIAGAVNYQACDTAICYPLNAVPVIWNVNVK